MYSTIITTLSRYMDRFSLNCDVYFGDINILRLTIKITNAKSTTIIDATKEVIILIYLAFMLYFIPK